MREVQRRYAVLAGDDRPVSRRDGTQKRHELKFQRLLFATPQLFNDDRWPHTGSGLTTANHALPRLEVDREIIVTLKQPEAAHFVRGDSACREVGDASARELNPRIGDIDGR